MPKIIVPPFAHAVGEFVAEVRRSRSVTARENALAVLEQARKGSTGEDLELCERAISDLRSAS